MIKRKGFQFQPMNRAKQAQQGAKNGLLGAALLSMASDTRIQEATPSLRALYEFLRIKPGERPRP